MNEKQLKLRTMFVGARGVDEYRATIPTWVKREDRVLEIGCEWGVTTKVLAEHSDHVIGTDISPKVIKEARQQRPGLRFEVLDGFDIRAALQLGADFNKIYIDVSGLSGYRSLLDVIALLNMYATAYRADAIVIKSGSLKHFAQHCVAWQGAAVPSESAGSEQDEDDQI